MYRGNNKSMKGRILKSLSFLLKIIPIAELFGIAWELNTTFQRAVN